MSGLDNRSAHAAMLQASMVSLRGTGNLVAALFCLWIELPAAVIGRHTCTGCPRLLNMRGEERESEGGGKVKRGRGRKRDT